MDDALAVFRSEEECSSFLNALNSMHSALKFTFEKVENDPLPFLAHSVTTRTIVQFILALFFCPAVVVEHLSH